MNNYKIGIFDSGIGGITLLTELCLCTQNVNYFYFGDNGNAPYGNRNHYDLLTLAKRGIDILKPHNIDLIIVACNTLSLAVLSQLKQYADKEIVGVFPPVEYSVLNGKKTLLFSTEVTAKNYMGEKNNLLTVVNATELVKKIESKIFDLNSLSIDGEFQNVGEYDTVILGCTHFVFLKERLQKLYPNVTFISGNTITKEKVLQLLKPQFIRKSQYIEILGDKHNHYLDKNAKNNSLSSQTVSFLGDFASNNQAVFDMWLRKTHQ